MKHMSLHLHKNWVDSPSTRSHNLAFFVDPQTLCMKKLTWSWYSMSYPFLHPKQSPWIVGSSFCKIKQVHLLHIWPILFSQLGLKKNAPPPVRSDPRFHYLVAFFLHFRFGKGTSRSLMHPLKNGQSLQSFFFIYHYTLYSVYTQWHYYTLLI